MNTAAAAPAPALPVRPPGWLIITTVALALTCLVLAVAETNLWAHYLIDTGEFVSLFGLAFILIAGVFLYRARRLSVSLPLIAPWLLYPVITQGDQIIDNLSINPMRFICQVLLAAIFGAPVAVVVLAARYALTPKPGQAPRPRRWTAVFPGLRLLAEGRTREGMALLGAALLVAEIWVADVFLGTLMIVTLIVMVLATLLYGSLAKPGGEVRRRWSERAALIALLTGVAISFALYIGYKNRPGAYQGSPSYYLDPSQKSAGYPLDRVTVPNQAPVVPPSPAAVREALNAYAGTLEELLAGYHLLDRNYTYDFHNELFLRHTPLVADYRHAGLARVANAERLRSDADARAAAARSTLGDDSPLAALVDDLHGYVAFNFDRAPTLEQMSERFGQTKAGLQHAAHLYEGESKMLGVRLADIMAKHHAVLEAPSLHEVTGDFGTRGHAIYETYAHHVVGF